MMTSYHRGCHATSITHKTSNIFQQSIIIIIIQNQLKFLTKINNLSQGFIKKKSFKKIIRVQNQPSGKVGID